MKKGFGILEVLIAAVVLGFLIIGLNKLQLGNREALLRVRERDAASFIAQHVLDSLGALGINSIEVIPKAQCDNKDSLVYYKKDYKYNFEGNSNGGSGSNISNISAPINYTVEVKLWDSTATVQKDFTKYSDTLKNTYAKSLKATVRWDFKNSTQSITVAKVVR